MTAALALTNPSAWPQRTLWSRGWYRFATPLPSPNFGARPPGLPVDLIVLHCISLPPGHYGGHEVQDFFTNRLDWGAHPWFHNIRSQMVSAHFYIRRTGELWQFVSGDDRAWHAGVSCYLGHANCNDHSIGVELEGLPTAPFEAAQYDTLNALCSALMQHYPIAHVAGHEHIAPGRKTDPGTGFDWRRMQNGLALRSECLPPAVRS